MTYNRSGSFWSCIQVTGAVNPSAHKELKFMPWLSREASRCVFHPLSFPFRTGSRFVGTRVGLTCGGNTQGAEHVNNCFGTPSLFLWCCFSLSSCVNPWDLLIKQSKNIYTLAATPQELSANTHTHTHTHTYTPYITPSPYVSVTWWSHGCFHYTLKRLRFPKWWHVAFH